MGREGEPLSWGQCLYLTGGKLHKAETAERGAKCREHAAASPGGGETFLSKNTCFPGPEQTQCLRGGGSSWGCVYPASAGLRSMDTASPGAQARVQRDRPGRVPLLIGVRAAPAPSSESR